MTTQVRLVLVPLCDAYLALAPFGENRRHGGVLVRRIGGTIIWCLRAVPAGLAVFPPDTAGGRSPQ
jgi:hypothetical protein